MPFIILAALAALVVAFLVVGLIAITLRRVVPTNEVHIVQTGKTTTSYGKDQSANTYYAWPAWVPVLGLRVIVLPVSVFEVSLFNYDAYDKDRVPFKVDVVSFFRISESNTAAQRIATFEELEEQLEIIVKGAVRSVLAKDDINDIMVERSRLGRAFTDEVAEQLKNWGVENVKALELMDIRDADGSYVIHNIMAKRTSEIEKDSRMVVANNKRAAEMAEIEAGREVEMSKQQAAEQIGKRTAEKDKAVGMAEEQSKQEIKVEQVKTAERDAEVRRVNEVKTAEIARDVEIVRAEQEQRTTVINANARKEATVIEAEADKRQVELKAEGQLTAQLKLAEGIQAEGIAVGAAEQARLMAPVQAQITLAKEIGTNPAYQNYLLGNRQIEATEAIGKANAAALEKADVKLIANTGDNVGSGISGITDLFSPKGGQALGTMLEGIIQSPAAKAILERVTGAEIGGQSAPAPAALPNAESVADAAEASDRGQEAGAVPKATVEA